MTILERYEQLKPSWGNSILVGYRGSTAHGTKDQSSDIDIFGISIQPVDYYLGLSENRESLSQSGPDNEIDVVVYDIRKLFSLAIRSNPNVMEWLWNNEEHYLYQSDIGRKLIENRDIFLSKEAFSRLFGYAVGQMNRMTENKLTGGGSKRNELIEAYGYDTKNASHCLRLLLMGLELARKGTLHTHRPPAEIKVLKSVREGEISLNDMKVLIEMYSAMFKEYEETSDLPDTVDFHKANKLLIELIKEADHEST